MARTRHYRLPSGKKTTREGSFKKQWTDFLKPVAKSLGLSIGTFNSQEAELLVMQRKGNGKKVPKQRVTLPHWVVWGIQLAYNRYERRIINLMKVNAALRAENRAYKEIFEAAPPVEMPDNVVG